MPRKLPTSIATIVSRAIEVAIPLVVAAVTEAITARLTRPKVAESNPASKKQRRKLALKPIASVATLKKLAQRSRKNDRNA